MKSDFFFDERRAHLLPKLHIRCDQIGRAAIGRNCRDCNYGVSTVSSFSSRELRRPNVRGGNKRKRWGINRVARSSRRSPRRRRRRRRIIRDDSFMVSFASRARILIQRRGGGAQLERVWIRSDNGQRELVC